MKLIVFLLLIFYRQIFAEDSLTLENLREWNKNEVICSTTRIELEDFPDAYNPSIVKFKENFLLTFRYSPDRFRNEVSYIGVVLLNSDFEVVSQPQLLSTRVKNDPIPSQSEDARVFSYRGRLFLIYNDNTEVIAPTIWERRDMFIAELLYTKGRFSLSKPLKLFCEEKYNSQLWQKNWVPFESNKTLLFGYTVNPHEILYPNLKNGECYVSYKTGVELRWEWGTLRGSTPPLLVDGEYLAFFHSGKKLSSFASWDWDLWHYFMGAYTFSAVPPFQITKITPTPLAADGFYMESEREKRVIFPGGFVVVDSSIYVAYGKDDCEIWIATLDKEALKKAMVSVNSPK